MPRTHYSARIDTNHAEIRDALEQAGYIVIDTFRAGFGCPDLFVLSKTKRWVGMEVKAPGGRLSKAEKELFDRVGVGPLFCVVSTENALDIMQHFDKDGDFLTTTKG